ncbi:MAG: GntR family transcriptional regulator [Pseudonocardiaceae bacterium]
MPEPDPPLFRRIAADLRDAIRRGEYLPGHQLPSGTALAAQYNVATQTVWNAINLLRAEGLVVGLGAQGKTARQVSTVEELPADGEVAAHLRTDQVLEDLGHAPTRYEDEITWRMPTPDETEKLTIAVGTPVGRLLRTTFDQNERPIEVYIVILPADRHVLLYDVSAE